MAPRHPSRPGEDERRVRGLYATPPALAGYLVRSVHVLLQTRLGWEGGLAATEVRLLDPAAGSMNFLRAAWRQAVEAHRGSGGVLCELVRCHLLPHFLGVEVREQACSLGARSLKRFLSAFGYEPVPADPAPILRADSLAPPPERLAPANVVIGNPPWRGRSSNRGAWITGLLRGYSLPDGRRDEGYFRVDGLPLSERNPKWLGDDYVKFLRLAQWHVDRSGEGIVGLVLNHTFLDAPTFRGLRRSLLRTFQEIYAFDLHGNARRQERGPKGERDENVFPEIAQGVAILLLVRKPGLRPRVLRADLQGSRREKLQILAQRDAGVTPWREVTPRPPGYLFVAGGDRAVEREYQRGVPLPEIFPVHGVGLVTGRDALATALDRPTLERRFARLRRLPPGAAPPGLSDRHLEELRRDRRWRGKLTGFLARPFDVRFVLYAPYLLERPRAGLMAHMLHGSNLGLIAPRQCKEEPGALVSRWLAGHKVVSAHDVDSLFPLYLDDGPARRPNVAPHLARRLAERYGAEPEPEALLGYVYAVLYSAVYRHRYREPLRRGFPRIPFPEDPRLFATAAALGRELIGLHLLTDPRLSETRVLVLGDLGLPLARNRQIRYAEGDQVLVLTEGGLALAGIEPEVWEYRIGGYRVLDRWLKAREGRLLSAGEQRQLPRIAEALRLTLELQSRVDEVTLVGGAAP